MQNACPVRAEASRAVSQREAGGNEASAAAGSPLAGRTVVVLGAGGAGRALAFGAADKGAKVGALES